MEWQRGNKYVPSYVSKAHESGDPAAFMASYAQGEGAGDPTAAQYAKTTRDAANRAAGVPDTAVASNEPMKEPKASYRPQTRKIGALVKLAVKNCDKNPQGVNCPTKSHRTRPSKLHVKSPSTAEGGEVAATSSAKLAAATPQSTTPKLPDTTLGVIGSSLGDTGRKILKALARQSQRNMNPLGRIAYSELRNFKG
jgi:hypothetical protein